MRTDDTRIAGTKELISPAQIHEQLPISEKAKQCTMQARKQVEEVIAGNDDRLVVIVGPCSIHDPVAAVDYAKKLRNLSETLKEDLCIVMRVYFEKPRTTIGWKGLINDPDLDGSYKVNKGLAVARKLLLQINDLGVSAGCEYLDLITPQYIGDVVAWGAIGARTTESQCHRELTSGLSCPVGFKNGTNGDVDIAVDAIKAAQNPHHFLSITKEGRTAIFTSTGNPYTHIILRGGSSAPNYKKDDIKFVSEKLSKNALAQRIMIDFSHANSEKDPKNQHNVCKNVADQISEGNNNIFGVMIESNLTEGKQSMDDTDALAYGVSITDGCIGWQETERLCSELAQAIRRRRKINL